MAKTASFLLPQKDIILELRRKGISQKGIALRLGVNQSLVSALLRSIGQGGRNYEFFTEFTQHQKDILIGTLLGDGHLALSHAQQNPALTWTHGRPQVPYLIWKAEQFGALFKSTEPSIHEKPDGNFVCGLFSRCHPILLEYYHLLYTRPDDQIIPHRVLKKRITPEVLERVTPKAFAIWWADDGLIARRRRERTRDALGLCAGAMTKPEYDLIGDWLIAQGIAITRCDYKPEKTNCVQWWFSADASEKLAAEIAPHIPACMHQKLGKYAPSTRL